MSDIVIDTQIMRLYDAPGDPKYKALFLWVATSGTLRISQKLLTEYFGTGNRLLGPLIDKLLREGRLQKTSTDSLKKFSLDKGFKYSCNNKDIWHAKLVFISHRKKLVSHDNNLRRDVNKFRKIDGIKPLAVKTPPPDFYI